MHLSHLTPRTASVSASGRVHMAGNSFHASLRSSKRRPRRAALPAGATASELQVPGRGSYGGRQTPAQLDLAPSSRHTAGGSPATVSTSQWSRHPHHEDSGQLSLRRTFGSQRAGPGCTAGTLGDTLRHIGAEFKDEENGVAPPPRNRPSASGKTRRFLVKHLTYYTRGYKSTS